jgi:hypothetical protein
MFDGQKIVMLVDKNRRKIGSGITRQFARDFNLAREFQLRFSSPPPTQTVAEYAVENFIFNEPEVKGPVDFTGRCYLIQPLNENNDPTVSRQTFCWGTGNGKTILFMMGMAWKVIFRQPRTLWVMPAEDGPNGTANFANTRMIPMLRASPALAAKIPRDRHKIGGTRIHMNGTVIDFTGSNSSSQLSGNRCSDIRCDEVDKFPAKIKEEAGALHQATTRADGVIGAQIFISSSPSVEAGAVWQSLMASNLQRRFIPCPRCGRDHPTSKNFVMIWNEQFCVLPNKFPDGREIPTAKIKWDDAAKRKDGSWDMDRVIRSARMICPNCGGDVLDSDMEWCDANGVWLPTRAGSSTNKHQGYHLPSLYAPRRDFESTFGGLAKKFLEANASAEGMRGFINSKLAEVDNAQEHGSNKIELSDKPIAQPDWITLLTADFQKNWPFIWFVARRWCAFKLLPKFEMINGRPDFVSLLDREENASAKKNMDALVSNFNPAWVAFAELMRFASFKENDQVMEFLISQKITGERLVNFFDKANGDATNLRATIYKEMKLPAPKGGDSELVAAGNLSGSEMIVWDEFRDVVKHFKPGVGLAIPNRAVAIDCGYAEKFNREVLRKCFESATEYNFYDPTASQTVPIFFQQARHAYCLLNAKDSWFSLRGTPVNKPLGKSKINHEIGLSVADPYYGSAEAGTKVVETLEIPSGLFWLRKEDFRRGREKLAYGVSPDVSWFPKINAANGDPTLESNFKIEDYERHLNEQYFSEKTGKVEPRHGRGGQQGRSHPYHLDDCETYQIALATHHEFFQNREAK